MEVLVRPPGCSVAPRAEHFVAKAIGDVQLAAALAQRQVPEFLGLTGPPSSDDSLLLRMHQDFFTKVLCGQAEVDEGVAKR